jgi:nicotinate-nucleotide pyrophosphorylase (carboxylating)
MNSTLFHHSLNETALENIKQAMLDNVFGALTEDIGSTNISGDFTAQLIPQNQLAAASIVSRDSAVICGLPWAQTCFNQLDPNINIDWQIREGDHVMPNQILAKVFGNARAMLSAERCALNFLQTLSATATATQVFVNEIKGCKAKILDTRKTIPGLRLAQKYAVLVGGGLNQRLGLYDGILIKENHIAAAGGVAKALAAAKQINRDISIQIEVENLSELQIALEAGASSILLDNFSTSDLAEAVKINHGRAILEASGGIHQGNVRSVALTGVDRISVGQLTKHIQAIDLSMRFD